MNNKQDIINILLVSLDDKFAKNVSGMLADNLDMFVADCKELIEYDLVDSKNVLKTCGLEYLKKREKKVIKNCASYENTVLTINIDLFKNYSDLFDRSLVVYLRRKRKAISKVVNVIGYENYDEFIKENVDIIVDFDKSSAAMVVEMVLQKMKEILWK